MYTLEISSRAFERISLIYFHLLPNIGFRYSRGRAPRSLRIATSYQAPFPRVRKTALLTSELMRTFSPFLNWARACWYPLRISSMTSCSPWTLPFEDYALHLKRPWGGPVLGRIEAGCGGKETLYFWQDVFAVYLQALHAFAPLWPHNIPQTFRRK